MADRSELLRLLGEDRLARPVPAVTAQGLERRDPRPEWNWFYCLDAGLQRYIADGRHGVMVWANGSSGNGLAPDDLASAAGYDYVETWADALVNACKLARDRGASDDWAGDYAPEDDETLLGPDELAAYLGVSTPTVRKWRERGNGPRVAFRLSGMDHWTLGDVRQWAADTGRILENVA
jgi:hypothetical protein